MGEKVAFIGLGAMGWPMAGFLVKAGHEVAVFNRTRAKAEAWVRENGGRAAASPAEAAAGAVFVASCVTDDAALRAVATGPDGAFRTLASGAVFADHSTTSAAVAEELFAAGGERGIHVLDAPVTGALDGARAGRLAIMVGGGAEGLAKAEPFLRAYGRVITHVGPAGHGQLAKLTNQIMIAAHMQALAEGIFFADETGLDTGRVLEAIADGSASSWWMENRADKIRRRDFDPKAGGVDMMSKDMGLALAEARRLGVSLPVTAVIAQLWIEMQARGQGGFEAIALITLLGKLGGKTR